MSTKNTKIDDIIVTIKTSKIEEENIKLPLSICDTCGRILTKAFWNPPDIENRTIKDIVETSAENIPTSCDE